MVIKTQTCRFSGLKIYPGKGIFFVRTDGQSYLFLNKKTRRLYHQRKRPAKIAWTVTYRKQHRKDMEGVVTRKKRRTVHKASVRAISGATLEVLQKRRQEKPEQRKLQREEAVRQVKDRMKKQRDAKTALKAKDIKASGPKAAKIPPRAGAKAGKR